MVLLLLLLLLLGCFELENVCGVEEREGKVSDWGEYKFKDASFCWVDEYQ